MFLLRPPQQRCLHARSRLSRMPHSPLKNDPPNMSRDPPSPSLRDPSRTSSTGPRRSFAPRPENEQVPAGVPDPQNAQKPKRCVLRPHKPGRDLTRATAGSARTAGLASNFTELHTRLRIMGIDIGPATHDRPAMADHRFLPVRPRSVKGATKMPGPSKLGGMKIVRQPTPDGRVPLTKPSVLTRRRKGSHLWHS